MESYRVRLPKTWQDAFGNQSGLTPLDGMEITSISAKEGLMQRSFVMKSFTLKLMTSS